MTTAFLALFLSTAWGAASRSGAILMQQPVGARPYSMAQAYSALADDAFGLFYNPASLTRLHESQLGSQFIQGLVDTRVGYGVFATPITPRQALGVSIGYMDLGAADVYDDAGQKTSAVSAERDFMVSFGTSRLLWKDGDSRLHLGASAKMLRSTIFSELETTAYAADAGALYERGYGPGTLSLAAVATNFGPALKYTGRSATGHADPLPAAAHAGAGYSLPAAAGDQLSFGLQVNRELADKITSEGIGLEYAYHRTVSLRAGYLIGPDLGRLTLGAGLQLGSISFDYGFGLVQTLNNVHQISANYRFAIPGIRYSDATTADRMLQNVSDYIAAGRLLDAADEMDQYAIRFHGSRLSAELNDKINAKIAEVLAIGMSAPTYRYSLAYRYVRQADWQNAVEALGNALKYDPANGELKSHLASAKKELDGQRKQLKLQQQATVSTLFELASNAYEGRDLERANRILGELLRVAPYAPAERLRAKIREDERRLAAPPPEKAAAPAAPARPKPVEPAPPAQTIDPRRSEQLYNEALVAYAKVITEPDPREALRLLEEAMSKLRQGLALDPSNTFIKNSIDIIEREMTLRGRAK